MVVDLTNNNVLGLKRRRQEIIKKIKRQDIVTD